MDISNWDVQLAIQFLQAQEGDIIEDNNNNNNNNNNNERLPRDFMDKPPNWRAPKELEEKIKQMRSKENNDEGKYEELRIEVNEIKKLFITEESKSMKDHLDFYLLKKHKYLSMMLILIEQGVEMSLNVKAKLLANLLIHKEWKGLPEILRACKFLDSPRKVKFLQKKIAQLQNSNSKNSLINKFQLQLTECREFHFEDQKTSLSSSIIKRIKNWVNKIPEKDLQFWALQMPSAPWRELSDLIHLSPNDFKLDWYLKFIYGTTPPQNSLAVVGKQIHGGNVKSLCEEFKIPYSFIRKQIKNISIDVKQTVASYENIGKINKIKFFFNKKLKKKKKEVLLWYYEELVTHSYPFLRNLFFSFSKGMPKCQ